MKMKKRINHRGHKGNAESIEKEKSVNIITPGVLCEISR
jgi:hypothetical protein